MATVEAAGAVVLRRGPRRTEVAVIHRPRYNDWTLPKGKLVVGKEVLPACAVREVREESGLDVVLDVPLDSTSYRMPGGDRKVVHYWRAHQVADHGLGKRNDEVDELRWVDAEGTLRRLSKARDRRVVAQAVALPETTAVAIVRHGKAMTRKRWKGGADVRRPLVRRGEEQARDLVAPLAGFGIRDLRSSAGTRCVQTLEPAAKRFDVPLTTYELLTEEAAAGRPRHVALLVASLASEAARRGEPLALCGHRPVLPDMFEGVGLHPRGLGTGDLVVAHLTASGTPVAWEHHPARR